MTDAPPAEAAATEKQPRGPPEGERMRRAPPEPALSPLPALQEWQRLLQDRLLALDSARGHCSCDAEAHAVAGSALWHAGSYLSSAAAGASPLAARLVR